MPLPELPNVAGCLHPWVRAAGTGVGALPEPGDVSQTRHPNSVALWGNVHPKRFPNVLSLCWLKL